ncbi:MAG: sulfatase-like hydrolase/transferase [Verrucomicrobiota bacterium]
MKTILTSFAALAILASLASAKQPNIIIYMVDDLGWNHISADQVTMGTHSDQYRTPELEKLANEGLSFTHAYAQPNCAPTRAAMLSGQYPARIHNDVYVVQSLSRFSKDNKKDPDKRRNGGITKEEAKFIPQTQTEDVAPEAVTIAEALKKNGYATAHIGKYHVGGHEGEATMPENVGFDINIGGFSQGHQPTCFASKIDGEWNFKNVGLGHFGPWAKPYDQTYIKEHNLPDSLVGSPKHISDAVGDALEETIATLTAGEKPFYLQFHTYAVHGPVKARPDLLAAAEEYAESKAQYPGFIASVDENLRRMREILDDPNGDGDTSDSIADNTLILFTSDNGGTHAENTPLKGHKGMLSEGGIRVPLIAHWPGVIPAGTVTDRKIHCLDYYPTCLELAGGKWTPDPDTHPLDGESFAFILSDPKTAAKKENKREPIFYFFPGYMDVRAQPSAAVIDDVNGKRYKLYYEYEADDWELYCLTDDQSEANNLIKLEPEIASTLSKKIHRWLTQEHPTWQPKYPTSKATGKPSGPPPTL